MTWTKEEIIRNYEEAKDKVAQVQILAELTASDTDTIIAILEDAGVFEPKIRTCTICYKKYKTLQKKGVAICPECRKVNEEVAVLKRELKYITAKIQQLGLDSARIRARIEKLEGKK